MNPVYVDDAAGAVVRAVETRASGTIDIAGPGIVTIREMAGIIGSRLNRAPSFSIDADRTADQLVGDVTRMTELLHGPRVPFADGIGGVLASGSGGT